MPAPASSSVSATEASPHRKLEADCVSPAVWQLLLGSEDAVCAARHFVTALVDCDGIAAAVLWRNESQRNSLLAHGGDISTTLINAALETTITSDEVWNERRDGDGLSADFLLRADGGALFVLRLIGPAVAETTELASLSRQGLQRVAELDQHQRLLSTLRELAEAERLQRALFRIADLAGADMDMAAMFAAVHQVVAELMYAENLYIALYDIPSGLLRFPYFVDVQDRCPPLPDEALPLSDLAHSLTANVILRGEALRGTPDAINSALGGGLKFIGPDCVDWLGVPLRVDGNVAGALVVQSYSEQARYDESQQALLSYVAQHISTAIVRKQAHQALEERVAERTEALRRANTDLRQEIRERQRSERLQGALFRIAELGSTSDTIEAFYAAVHEVVSGLLYARNFYIALLNEREDALLFPYQVDQFDSNRKSRRLGRGLTEYVLRTATPLLADRSTIERLREEDIVVGSGTESVCWLGVPLICSDQTVGVLAVQSYSDAHRYDSRDQELLTFVSYHIANALERKRSAESLRAAYAELEQRVADRTRALFDANRFLREQITERERIERQLKHETLHDALTGLPNRTLLMNRLTQALARFEAQPDSRFAVLFLDLDRFKVINDSVGHLVGDELLREAGARILSCLRGNDIVARMGGDEFAIIAESIESVDEALMLAQRVVSALDQPFRLQGRDLYTSSSIGIAVSEPSYSRAEELLRDADAAMYKAKSQGRRRVEVFDEYLHLKALQRLELENDLRQALINGEIEPWFQPITCLASGQLRGFEALARWRHPRRGLLLPAEFLNHAEESGQVEALDWAMLDLALRCYASWQTRFPSLQKIFLSVNFSGVHFRSLEFPDRLAAALSSVKLSPGMLRLEVTERALLEQPEIINRVLNRLRDLRIAVSLDDFGTGYSSLSYLQQYPLDALKIDQSFVRGLSEGSGGSRAIVEAILSIAKALGMQVIAEGVETEAERQMLIELGCSLGQGYLMSRPCDASKVAALLTVD